MTNSSSPRTLRGVLAHRAVLWPFTRPSMGAWLERFKEHNVLVGEVDVAMDLLERSVRSSWETGKMIDYRATEALLNFSGPSDDTASFWDTSQQLNDDDRERVFDRLRLMTKSAAEEVENWLRSRSTRGRAITCAWSEVPVFASDGLIGPPNVLHRHLRADLVGFRSDGEIEVIDLKFGNSRPLEGIAQAHRAQLQKYIDAIADHPSPRGKTVTGRILYIDGSGGRSSTRWTEVLAAQPKSG